MAPAEPSFPLQGRRIFVAGHADMVGSAVNRRLTREGCTVLTVARRDLDLCRQADTEAWMAANRPDAVVAAAARVGGILANHTRPADFLYDNLMIEANLIHAAWQTGVAKLLFLGSSCIYPREAAQPMAEAAFLTGPLEPTNQWYAVAKIAGLKLAEAYRAQHGCDFISAMPTNFYGPGDNFDLETSHVVPALLRRMHEAKRAGLPSVTLWGSGTPRREFMHVDDCADALVFLLQRYSGAGHVNIGSGEELSIRAVAEMVRDTVGYTGDLVFDPEKPDGAPRKLLDSTLLKTLGWMPAIGLKEGLAETYRWYLAHAATEDSQAPVLLRK